MKIRQFAYDWDMRLIRNDEQLSTLQQVNRFLEGSEALEFRGLTTEEKCRRTKEVDTHAFNSLCATALVSGLLRLHQDLDMLVLMFYQFFVTFVNDIFQSYSGRDHLSCRMLCLPQQFYRSAELIPVA